LISNLIIYVFRDSNQLTGGMIGGWNEQSADFCLAVGADLLSLQPLFQAFGVEEMLAG
jgi:hypothetical protein